MKRNIGIGAFPFQEVAFIEVLFIYFKDLLILERVSKCGKEERERERESTSRPLAKGRA